MVPDLTVFHTYGTDNEVFAGMLFSDKMEVPGFVTENIDMRHTAPKEKMPPKEKEIPTMPFDDALRKLMNTPPPQKGSKKEQKKTGK